MTVTKLKSKHSWRDVIPVHPAAALFPSISGEDLRKLGDDIEKNGLRSPIVLWAEGDQVNHGPYQLLDGQNRLDAMELVGLSTYKGESIATLTLAEYSHVTGNRSEVILHLHEFAIDINGQRRSAVDPYAYAISNNLRRRHLTKEQQAELIVAATKIRAENDHLNLRRSFSPTVGEKGGSTKDPIKTAVVQAGKEQGISAKTMERVYNRSNRQSGKPRKPRVTKASPKNARVRHVKKEMQRLEVHKDDL